MDRKEKPKREQQCEPRPCPPGPVREAGGTTGAGNLSPGEADRTGGATGGVATGKKVKQRLEKFRPPPSA